jgi:endonuclease/exonuclease/phosphatase family metal-dependent hydrolase
MVRVATYNVENLFSRPVLFNWQDHAAAGRYLDKINQLSRLLNKLTYSAADKKRAAKLYEEVKPYIDINLRSSEPKVGRYLFAKGKLQADGRDEWDGFIDLKRERFDQEQVKFTAKVIRSAKADIQCLVEVESAETLTIFNTDRLSAAYSDRIVIDGNDPRGIDIALAAKKQFPIVTAQTNIFARNDAGKTIFSRDCLEVELKVGATRTLHVLVNHFKAKDRTPEVSDAKREAQATEVSRILKERYDLKKDYVIVAGDLNDEPDSKPLKPLVDTPNLHNVLDLANWPKDDRWTYYYHKEKAYNVIDYLFVSSALKAKVQDVGFERRGIFDLEKLTNGAAKSFPGIDTWKLAGSDHALVWVDLDL